LKYFLSIFFILLFALNSISIVLPLVGSHSDIELSLDAESKTEQEQKEEKTEKEGKEKEPLYTYSTNSLLLALNGQKSKADLSNVAFIEDVNIKNPTPPPEQV
jgi:hypothetical protein